MLAIPHVPPLGIIIHILCLLKWPVRSYRILLNQYILALHFVGKVTWEVLDCVDLQCVRVPVLWFAVLPPLYVALPWRYLPYFTIPITFVWWLYMGRSAVIL